MPTKHTSLDATQAFSRHTPQQEQHLPLSPLVTSSEPHGQRRLFRKKKPPVSHHALPPRANTHHTVSAAVVKKRQDAPTTGYSRWALIRIVSVFLLLMIALSVFSLEQNKRANTASQTLHEYYGGLLDDLSTSLSSLDGILQKLPYAHDPATLNTLSVQLAEQALTATQTLQKLPVEQSQLQPPLTFLTQLHQYGIQLSRRFGGIKAPLPLPSQTLQTLTTLKEQTQEFAYQMITVRSLFEGTPEALSLALAPVTELAFEDISDLLKQQEALAEVIVPQEQAAGSGEVAASAVILSPTNPAKNANPSQPIGADLPNISMEQAKQIAIQNSGIPAFDLQEEIAAVQPLSGDFTSRATPALYVFRAGERQISVTKQGGRLYQMSKPRLLASPTLSPDEARHQASLYLEGLGLPHLQHIATAEQEEGQAILFAFAPRQEEILLYTDMIRIAIALDTGEVIWVDASNVQAHAAVYEPRSKTVSLEVATQKMSPRLTLESSLLCLRPATESHRQAGIPPLLCYELTCSSPTGTSLRYYVNAITGAVEDLVLTA